MSTPLVTVITPCFNAGPTLHRALASLLVQTVDDWECIVIDDGSHTPARQVVERFGDRRFRLHRFAQNRGRSVARQRGLHMARGRFVCMLDADDWYYPDKLAHQLRVMNHHPDIAAVTNSLAVVDDACRLRGVRTFTDADLELRRGRPHRMPDIGFPPVMIRRKHALGHRFDPRLRRAQDADYLMRVLAGQPYAVSHHITYAYTETWSVRAVDEALSALSYQRLMFRRDFHRAPANIIRQYATNLLKTGLYRAARKTRRGKWLFERRNHRATARQAHQFEKHRRLVMRAAAHCHSEEVECAAHPTPS